MLIILLFKYIINISINLRHLCVYIIYVYCISIQHHNSIIKALLSLKNFKRPTVCDISLGFCVLLFGFLGKAREKWARDETPNAIMAVSVFRQTSYRPARTDVFQRLFLLTVCVGCYY